MKKLDEEQKQAVTDLYKVAFAREMIGFVKLDPNVPDMGKLNFRAHNCWDSNARLTIIEILSDKRDDLISKLGLEKSPFTN